ncbi:hypothetical protein [Verminephrobacter aporrectodeae]|uniref:hypothetical protein n=1 Tax=Verminephrobacter aporrectodeae TaxID=1110389 RepID=UPI0022432F6C|nr:hypothetical protein [Verminephrobacter aporrectodeae]
MKTLGVMMSFVRKKFFRWIVFLVLLIFFLIWIHWFRTFEDRSFESMLIEKLTLNKEVKISEIIPDGERVCFFPPYSTAESVESLSKIQKDFLNIRINSFFGTDDNIWWIAVLSREEVLNIYRMSSGVRPNLEEERCIKQKNSKLIFSDKSEYTVYFDLSEGV